MRGKPEAVFLFFPNPCFHKRSPVMKFIGVDLHKQTISLCGVVVVDGKRKVVFRKRFSCRDTAGIRAFFERQGAFQVVVEATANYEWFLLLVEDLADRWVLAHPKKLRVIAESTRKSDKIDAQVLAEFLALDMIPEAYRPSERIRQYRVLVRHRRWLQSRITSLKCKVRHKAAHYNADIAGLFSERGLQHLAGIAMSDADWFETENLLEQLALCQEQLKKVDKQLREFAKTAPPAEREARAVLATMPEVGAVTIDVVLSELGDWRRFRSAKRVVSYAGLDPGSRESAGKTRHLKISKEGSRLLRWALIETAWRLRNKY
ncbi:MAG: IS110 family transposase, partial [Calditrichaeota bacterium]